MKRIIVYCLTLFCVAGMSATEPQQPKFSPEKFQADMEQFITTEAHLTPQEAAAFFPLLREMHQKQRSLFNQTRKEGRVKPNTEEACKKMIQRRDQVELELKSIQQTYHNKFFKVLPASKVFDAINAEDSFHRKMFRNWGQGPKGGHKGSKGKGGNKPTPTSNPR